MTWPDEALERQILSDAKNAEWRAGGYLQTNIEEIVKRLLARVRELEQREAIALAALKNITEADVYARQIADDALEALKGTP